MLGGWIQGWTGWAIRRRIFVVSVWLLLFLFGAIAAPKLSGHLSTSLAVPSSESSQAEEILATHFHENIEGTFTVLYKFGSATKEEISNLEERIAAAAMRIPTGTVTQQRALAGVLFANIATSFALKDASKYVESLRRELKTQGLDSALVTGPAAIYHDVTPILDSDLHRGQLIAVSVAFIFLLLLLGFSWAILIPYLFAAATISFSIGVIFLLSQKILMVSYIPNIVELIGFGLAIDYSLLIVHRFRRELAVNQSPDTTEVITRTMQTAGRTVILSGLCVSIGLAGLLLVPVPFVQSLGIAGLTVPLISLLAVLTLQPALLSFFGKTGIEPYKFAGLMTQQNVETGFFAKISNVVVAKPREIIVIGGLVLALFASPMLALKVTPSSLTSIPSSLESSRALEVVAKRVGHGVAAPNQIVIDFGREGATNTPEATSARKALISALTKNNETYVVATDDKAPFVDSTRRFLRIIVIGHHDLGAIASQRYVKYLRERIIPKITLPAHSKIYVGGPPGQGVDLLNKIGSSFPWILLFTFGFAYLILLRAFRSFLLPLLAIALDLLSMAVAYGSQVLIFKYGFASDFLSTLKLDQIEVWVLIFLFALLFGLSMDYEIFIVSRMREAKSLGMTNSQSIAEGIKETGGVVTAAAAIFIAALIGFVVGEFAGLQQLGIGLACGVVIDAAIIRLLVLPSAMILLGRWNWWLPESVARFIKSKASPLEAREARL